ncbi:hypothetical protein FRC07_005816 [Ceratobasidium sp. 392]|nr:hypothetical protein FRC07_005816 [Ceratobasidium sp. 392]
MKEGRGSDDERDSGGAEQSSAEIGREKRMRERGGSDSEGGRAESGSHHGPGTTKAPLDWGHAPRLLARDRGSLRLHATLTGQLAPDITHWIDRRLQAA